MSRKSTPVSPARRVAFTVLRRTFEDQAFTDIVLREEATEAGLTGRDRAQAQHLAFGAVQRRGTVDGIIGELSGRRPGRLDPPVLAALRLGLFELLFADGTPDHAAVNEAVELTRSAGAAHAAGFVNANLRRAGRERSRLLELINADDTPAQAALAHSLPEWLTSLWWEQLGEQAARDLARSVNQPAERSLRLNPARWSAEQAQAAAAESEISLRPATGAAALPGLPLDELMVVEGSWAKVGPWIEQGWVTPQSRGSAAVVEILDPQPGQQVLDVCAGPGTKTGQIAARLGGLGEIIAIELDEARAGEVAGQMRRLGVHNCSVVEMDAAQAQMGGPGFDRVLVDAPCSDLGALNSRPDARWRKSPALIERLTALQAEILAAAARNLGPGGTLVYSTCTISRTENEDQALALADTAGLEIDDLGAHHPELAAASDSRFLQIRPDLHATTGFFIARFRRPT